MPEFDFSSILNNIGAIGGIAGGVMDMLNSSSNSKTAKQAQKTNELVVSAALAPQVDARGNRYGYDRETGQWFIQLTDGTKRLIDASDALTMLQLSNAAGAQNEYANTRGYSLPDMQALYRRTAEGEIDRQYKDTEQSVVNQALRSGTSAGSIIDQLMKGRSRDASLARLNAEKEALTDFENLQGARTNRLMSVGQGANFSAIPSIDPARTAAGVGASNRYIPQPQTTYAKDIYGLTNNASRLFKDMFPSGKSQSQLDFTPYDNNNFLW